MTIKAMSKKCAVCGIPFQPVHSLYVVCSSLCRRERRGSTKRAWAKNNPEKRKQTRDRENEKYKIGRRRANLSEEQLEKARARGRKENMSEEKLMHVRELQRNRRWKNIDKVRKQKRLYYAELSAARIALREMMRKDQENDTNAILRNYPWSDPAIMELARPKGAAPHDDGADAQGVRG